jgi:hypothetical protein
MPYFKALNETVRYCFNAKHEAMELEEFLDAVEMMRVSASDLNALKFGGDRKHFTDGPYCLEVMASQGKITERQEHHTVRCWGLLQTQVARRLEEAP